MNKKLLGAACLSALLMGCAEQSDDQRTQGSFELAINIGGDAFEDLYGHQYVADGFSSEGERGEIERVLGAQDARVYQSFIEGDFSVDVPVENGVYDVTFQWAEPIESDYSEREFAVFIEDTKVFESINVQAARDGKAISALDRTIVKVEVNDGQLNLRAEALNGQPILSGLIIRDARPRAEEWQLVWSDEFDYEGAPDPTKWGYDIWPARKVNDEDQAYTERRENSRVEDGVLTIEAHLEDFDNAHYTSARLHTLGKLDLLYGRIEVRAKLPAGKGTWPAIWMLPSDAFRYATTCGSNADWQGSSQCDAWPNSGEIDIMEHVGNDLNVVHGTVHNKAFYWVNWEQRKGSVLLDSVTDAYHEYAIEWGPDQIDIFVDDSLYFSYAREDDMDWRAWPYDHEYHLIINLAIGGMWGRAGGPIDNSVFPQQMLVDYVRVYQR